MRISFHAQAWEEYQYWQRTDKKILRKLNQLIDDIRRHPFEGIGKPEPLKHHYSGSWSRRITDEHRIVYEVLDDTVVIQHCRFHY